jgi:hypothetical protein
MAFNSFFENFLLHGLEFFNKYYGVYSGLVTRIDDPEGRGRIQAHVPEAAQDKAPNVWIAPAFMGAGFNRGAFFPPEVGDSVWVSFANGDPAAPEVYWGGWYGKEDVPDEYATTNLPIGRETAKVPRRRGIITRKGHRIVFTDEDGEEAVEIAWHKPSSTPPSGQPASDSQQMNNARATNLVDPDAIHSYDRSSGDTHFIRFTEAGITLENKEGVSIQILVQNKKVVVSAENVELAAGADTPAMRGDDWMNWALNHNHGTAWGPSSPPLTPPPRSILSGKVRLK